MSLYLEVCGASAGVGTLGVGRRHKHRGAQHGLPNSQRIELKDVDMSISKPILKS
jgi:hypothetical protein